MRMRFGVFRTVGFFVLALILAAPIAEAESTGQDDLDLAIQTKSSAHTPGQFDKVIDLCESARAKGLNEENDVFCKQLLVATLLSRATDRAGVPDGWLDGSDKPEQASAKDWRAAIKDVERAAQVDPLDPEVPLVTAKLQMLRHGDRLKAREAVDEAIRLAQGNVAVKVAALRLRAGLHDELEDGLTDLCEAIEMAPHEAESLRLRGELYLRRNRTKQALADFDAAISLAPYDMVLELDRATALEALERYPEAREIYSRIVRRLPGQVAPLLHRARLSAMAGDHALVIDDANSALEIDPNQDYALLLRAGSLAQLERFEEALPDIDRAIALQPDSIYAIGLWVTIIQKTGRSNSAIKGLHQQVEANYDDSAAWLRLALLYSAQRRLGKAIDAYSAVIELGQQRAFAYQQRGDIYLNVGMHKEAIADYDEALKFDPDNSTAMNNLSWVLATSPEDALRDGKQAVELALKACDRTGYRQASLLSTLAAAYAEFGDFAAARKWSQQSVELAGDSSKGRYRKELASYEKDEPWRDKSATEADIRE